MQYFIKGNTIHTYPPAEGCPAKYAGEQIRDTILRGFEQCVYCTHVWPGKE